MRGGTWGCANSPVIFKYRKKMLNKQKGNMYGFVTHTWNPIKGKCPHDCKYCYMKLFHNLGELRLDEKALKDNLGEGNFIFIGSSTDMFAEEVPDEWIIKVLDYCKKFDNRYLFQTKNPYRYEDFIMQGDTPSEAVTYFPKNSILGVTLETNRREYHKLIYQEEDNSCPNIAVRSYHMERLTWNNRMISIEPILDFDLDEFVEIIKKIKPGFVSIGADSKGHNLPEPSKEKIEFLIKELTKFTEVRIKDNLKRLK